LARSAVAFELFGHLRSSSMLLLAANLVAQKQKARSTVGL